MGTAKFIRSKCDDIKKLMDTEWSHVKSEDKYMMDVDALRAVQTSGPTIPSTCLLRAGLFFQIGPKMRVREEDTKNK